MTARRPTTRPAITPSATVTNATSRGAYAGLELKPYAGRPRAMDAQRHPTRIGNRLHYRDGMVTDLAGNPIQPAGAFRC